MGQLLKQNHETGRFRMVSFTGFMVILALLMMVPFIFMISGSLKPPGEFTDQPLQIIPTHLYLENFSQVFSHQYYFIWYLNSIKVTLLVILFRLVVVTAAAYAFARLKFPFKNVLFMLAIATLLFPGDTTLVGRYLIYKDMNLLDTHWSLILPAISDPLMLFMMRQFLMKIPYELSEAAHVDGCSQLKIYYRIVLPLAVPALLTMILFTFIWTWNDFASPQIFITSDVKQMLAVGLTTFQTSHGPIITAQIAAALIGIIPSIAFFSFSQKYFIQGIAGSGIKG